jgi:hypothetical protein
MFYYKFYKLISSFGLLATIILTASTSQSAEFRYDSSTASIEMAGTIRVGDDVTFVTLLRSHPETESVVLRGSVGGEYTSSLNMSLEIRKRGLDTVAAGYCHSGCAYMWLAGASRSVRGSANPEIHLPYSNATREALPGLTYAWLKALGLPATFADAVVRSVGPDNRFVKLTPAFLTRFGALKAQNA